MKKTIKDIDVTDQRILMRVDLKVPMDDKRVVDDTRIKAALPSIQYLQDHGARLILCSHLDRPGGKIVEDLRLDPVADRLSDLLDHKVKKASDCVGEEVRQAVKDLQPGEILLLENTRFHAGEKANDPDFAKQLAQLADLYINDAFGTAHRAHASIEGVAHELPAVAGLLMKRELEQLGGIMDSPDHPFILVLGGAKISDKIGVIERFMDEIDRLLVGGGMANTFLKAQGFEVGESLIDDQSLDIAKDILDEAGDRLWLPEDAMIAESLEDDAEHQSVSINEIPPKWRIVDIGPRTIQRFTEELAKAKLVVWNGPMGVFEREAFAQGTTAIIKTLAEIKAKTIIGGGETGAAVHQAGLADRMTHVSTGGGAFLTLLEGGKLPGVEALDERDEGS
jgi:phosphoglycerate kinase